jgi:hypothetical protein
MNDPNFRRNTAVICVVLMVIFTLFTYLGYQLGHHVASKEAAQEISSLLNDEAIDHDSLLAQPDCHIDPLGL